jgi:hypothetical protein
MANKIPKNTCSTAKCHPKPEAQASLGGKLTELPVRVLTTMIEPQVFGRGYIFLQDLPIHLANTSWYNF